MTATKLVIGDRLGKGQKVGQAQKAAGATVTVIPGMAADMKLGGCGMNKEQADLGISFGSGGAGAITAQTKYGYKCRYGMIHRGGCHRHQRGGGTGLRASWTRKSWARS